MIILLLAALTLTEPKDTVFAVDNIKEKKEDSTVTFVRDGRNSFEFKANGDVFHGKKKLGNDPEILKGMHDFFAGKHCECEK